MDQKIERRRKCLTTTSIVYGQKQKVLSTDHPDIEIGGVRRHKEVKSSHDSVVIRTLPRAGLREIIAMMMMSDTSHM